MTTFGVLTSRITLFIFFLMIFPCRLFAVHSVISLADTKQPGRRIRFHITKISPKGHLALIGKTTEFAVIDKPERLSKALAKKADVLTARARDALDALLADVIADPVPGANPLAVLALKKEAVEAFIEGAVLKQPVLCLSFLFPTVALMYCLPLYLWSDGAGFG